MSVIKLFRLGIAMFSVFCTPTKTAMLSHGCLETRLGSDMRELKQIIGSLRYGDYGLRTTAGRALSFVCSTGLRR